MPGLLADLPQTALAAVVIMAAVSLADLGVLRRFARVRKSALALSLIATVGVVFFGVLEGILIAAILSILLFFKRNWWPEGAVLGYVQDLKSWHDVERYPEAEQTEGVVIYRWEAPLFFANAGIFRAADPQAGAAAQAALGRAAVRGHHRHRRHRGRHDQGTGPRAERRRASIWRSSSCGTGCRTAWRRTGCSRSSTTSTSSPR